MCEETTKKSFSYFRQYNGIINKVFFCTSSFSHVSLYSYFAKSYSLTSVNMFLSKSLINKEHLLEHLLLSTGHKYEKKKKINGK